MMNLSSAEEIVKLTSTITQDQQLSCVNQVLQIITKLESFDSSSTGSETIILALIKSLERIFCKYIDGRELLQVENRVRNPDIEKVNLFKKHLVKWYERVQDKLSSILGNGQFSVTVQDASLKTLLRYVEEEGKFPFREQEHNFPSYILQKMLEPMINSEEQSETLFQHYCNFFRFDDFIHFTIIELTKIIEVIRSQYQAKNLFEIVKAIKLTRPDNLLPNFLKEARGHNPTPVAPTVTSKQKTGERKTFMRMCPLASGGCEKYGTKLKYDYERDADLYGKLWLSMLKLNFDPATFRRVLAHLDKYSLKHFANPLLLADYLFELFSKGGLISLLSMSPLYVIMSRCQIEYPNFYRTLYNLLEPAVSYTKYRAQFLFWCDLFLTSTHISSKIVASFAKRLARLALRSSPDTCSVLLPFIGNLFIRHPMIQSMLRVAKFDPTNDPFKADEQDPEQTMALDSYMWELKALQEHYCPEIKETAKMILESQQTIEWNQEDTLETTMDDLIEKEAKKVEKVARGTYDINCNVFYSI